MLNILYTCDDSFLPLAGVSIASVIENNKETDICFYLATEKNNSENFNKLCDFYKDNSKVCFKYLDCRMYDELLEEKKFDKWGSSSFYVYWRMFAYDQLDIDEIWYLDTDILCLNTIDYPTIDKTAGAVVDCSHADYNRLAHIDESYYSFNTGSFYVNINKWKENRCTEKIIDFIKTTTFKPMMCDQDILSIALQDEIEVISPKYNYFANYDYYGIDNNYKMYSLDKKPFHDKKDVIEASKNIIFYHCLAGVFGRPWEIGNESPIKEEFEKYREISAWSDFSTKRNKSLLFKIENSLEVLPDGIYNRIHNLAQRIFLRIQAKNSQK